MNQSKMITAADGRGWTPRRVFLRLAGVSATTALLLAAGAIFLARLTPIAGSQTALHIAIAIGLLGSLAAAVCGARAVGRPAAAVATALLAGMSVRLGLTLGLALTVWGVGSAFHNDAFLIAVGVAQTVLLAVDSAAQLAVARQLSDAERNSEDGDDACSLAALTDAAEAR